MRLRTITISCYGAIGRPIYLLNNSFSFFRFIIIIMPALKFINSEQRAFFDDPKFYQSNEFLICMMFQEKRNMYYLLYTLFEYITIQDMEAFYIAIPPMRETTFILMETHSLRRVRFLVEKQINTHFMKNLYNLLIESDRDEVRDRLDDCWEHWKLIIDAMDLKTNYFCSFSAVMEQTDLEREMGCTPINWANDPAEIYQTKYEILCISIFIYEGAELFELDSSLERCEEMDVRYSFCGHIITKNGAQLQSCIEEALKRPIELLGRTQVNIMIRKAGKPEPEVRFNGKKHKMIQSFVDQGHMTEEDLARRDYPIYDEDGDMVKPANRERDIACTECLLRIDNYGQRQSSAVSTVVGWTRDPDLEVHNMGDIIDGEGLWVECRQHTSRRSTLNARLFKRAQKMPFVIYGDTEAFLEIPEVRSEEAEVETEANVTAVEEMIEMDQEIAEVWRDEWEVEMEEE